ncbi:MAG: CotH kinase family protein, partial [Ilumatobacteraceae bacterium]
MIARRLILLVSALTLTAAACSSDPDTSQDTAATATTTPPTPGTTDPGPTDPASTGDAGTATGTDDEAATGEVDVFDHSAVHDISLAFDQADYDAMIDTYQDTGEKEWIEATVTIDGHTLERAGVRLKGNSSLAGLGGFAPGGGRQPDTSAGDATDTQPDAGAGDTTGTRVDAPERRDGGLVEFGGASADSPQDLPWLIRLDEFVEGQTYQGYEDFVVRSSNTETALNEAVSLTLLDEAGLASQAAIATRFSVNDSAAVLRLVVEHPDDDKWYESWFDGDGALYKAESTGDWSYRGDDPTSYEEVFDQEGGSEVADLTPLIDFLQFINESDDAVFATELPLRLDVDAFATYLAMMELIGNFDDIDGPGNNAYLRWDATTEQFTVVPWDMNLSLGSGMGGGGFPGGTPGGEGGPPGGTLPDGMELPGGTLPGGMEPPSGSRPEGMDGEQGGFPGGGAIGGRSNPLVERFLANEEFNALYERRLT